MLNCINNQRMLIWITMCYHFEKSANKHQMLLEMWSWSWECQITILDKSLALSCAIEHAYTYSPGISLFVFTAEQSSSYGVPWNGSEVWRYWTPLLSVWVGRGWHCWSAQICCPWSWAFSLVCHTNSVEKVEKKFPGETLAGMHLETHTFIFVALLFLKRAKTWGMWFS